MKQQFNQLVSCLLSETDTHTECSIGTYIHYVPSQLSLFDDWKTFLSAHGFTLHHERENQMQDIFLTSDSLLCKVTCVSRYINVMFFDSLKEMEENRRKTIAFINKIYNR